MCAAEDVPDPSSRRDDDHGEGVDGDLADRLAEIDDTLSGHSSARDDGPADVDDAETAAELADHLDVILRLRAAAERDKARRKAESTPMPMSIGPFRIVREVGHGGCAIVWEAEDPRIKRHVALKVIRPDALLVPGSKERFLREAQLAGRINHAHVVTVYEVGESDGLAYIAMELCDGGSLADWLAAHPGPIPARLAAEIVRDLAEATAHAHGCRVIHRDITPGNVLLAADPRGPLEMEGIPCRAKLADFGLAMALADEESEEGSRLTQLGTTMGTYAWMAPEQVDPGEFGPIGPLTDVHALGLILDRLLTGRAPHAGRSRTDAYRAITLGEPRPADDVVPGLPRDIVAVGLKSRAKRPSARYASAADFAADLRRFLAGAQTLARPQSGIERAVVRLRKHAGPVGAACALALALLAGVVAHRLNADRLERDKLAVLRSRSETQEKAFDLWRLGDVKGAFRTLADPDLSATLPARWLAARTRAEQQRLLDRADPGGAFHHPERADLYCLALAGDGTVGVGGADGMLFLYAPVGTEPHLAIAAHNEINDIAFSPDGRLVATAGEDGAVRLWSRTDGRRVAEIVSRKGLFTVAFAPKGDRIAFGGRERAVEIQSLGPDGVPTGAVARHDPFEAWPAADGEPPDTQALLFLDDDTVAAASGSEVVLLAVDGGAVRRRLVQREGKIGQIVLSPDGSSLLAIGTNHRPHLWDRATGELIRRLPLHPGWVQGGAFSPDGGRIATGCRDGVIRVFDTATGDETGRMVGHADRTWDVVWEPTGTLVSAGADGTVRRWDPDDRPELSGLREHPLSDGPVTVVAPLGPPGSWLVAAIGAPVRLCSAPDGDCRAVDDVRFTHPIRAASLPDRSRAVLADAVNPHEVPRPDAAPSQFSLVVPDGSAGLVATALGSPERQSALLAPAPGTTLFASIERLLAIDTTTGATSLIGTFPVVIDTLTPFGAGSHRRLAVGCGNSLFVLPCRPDGSPDDSRRRELVREATGFGSFIVAAAASADGTRIAYGIRDRAVRVVDATSGAPIGPPIIVRTTPLALAWSNDGHSLVIADRDTVRLCNADTGATIDEIRPGWTIAAMGFEDVPGSPGMLLIGGGRDGGRLLTLSLGTR